MLGRSASPANPGRAAPGIKQTDASAAAHPLIQCRRRAGVCGRDEFHLRSFDVTMVGVLLEIFEMGGYRGESAAGFSIVSCRGAVKQPLPSAAARFLWLAASGEGGFPTSFTCLPWARP